jgi:Thioesterase-like superfamily
VLLYSQVLAGMRPAADVYRRYQRRLAAGTDGLWWIVGRTICVERATRSIPDLSPLRSAQFNFIEPLAGELRIGASVLRRVKSVTFVAADISGEHGVTVRATLCFGAARPSAFNYGRLPPPRVRSPETCERFFPGESPYAFTQHFDARLADGNAPFSGAKTPEFTTWLRHHDRDAPDSVATLLVLADMPPSAAELPSHPLAVSTLTWTTDIVTEFPLRDDGWRLVDWADTVTEGYSSQAINIWNREGKPLLVSRQCVAVFA